MRRTVCALLQKEFLQVIRDRNMLRLIFLMPLVQLFVLAYVVSTDVKLIRTAVYDFDRTDLSRELVRSMSAGQYFITETSPIPLTQIKRGFQEDQYSAALLIPHGFSQDLRLSRTSEIGFMVDGTNANSAAIALGYAHIMAGQFNQRMSAHAPFISLKQKKLYNPEGESIYFVVPGIAAMLLTLITVMLTSMAIVREREIGTLEQLMVTPITTPALILGKTIPFALIGLLELSIALFMAVTWFKIPFLGSWGLLYALSFAYLFTTLGAGILISTISGTQQQAMFFSWFFFIFILLTSGFFAPVNNMPQVIQYLTHLNPLRFYLVIVRAIMMKGATIDLLYNEILAIAAFGAAVFTIAWLRFSKRVK